MSNLYYVNNQTDYSSSLKSTGAGQAQVWDSAARTGGLYSGSVKFTLSGATTNLVYAYGPASASGSQYLRLRMYVDQTDLTYAAGKFFSVGTFGLDATAYQHMICYHTTGVKKIGINVYNDSGTFVANHFTTVADGVHLFEMEVKKGSSNVATDASVTYWVDGVLIFSIINFTFYDRFEAINRVAFGGASGVVTGLSGSFHVGHVLATDGANPIGPFLSYRHRPRPAAIMKKRQRIKGHRCG